MVCKVLGHSLIPSPIPKITTSILLQSQSFMNLLSRDTLFFILLPTRITNGKSSASHSPLCHQILQPEDSFNGMPRRLKLTQLLHPHISRKCQHITFIYRWVAAVVHLLLHRFLSVWMEIKVREEPTAAASPDSGYRATLWIVAHCCKREFVVCCLGEMGIDLGSPWSAVLAWGERHYVGGGRSDICARLQW